MKDETTVGMQSAAKSGMGNSPIHSSPTATRSGSTGKGGLTEKPKIVRRSCPATPASGITSIGVEADNVISLAAERRKKRLAQMHNASLDDLW